MIWEQPAYFHCLWLAVGWYLLRWWLAGRESRVVASTLVWMRLLQEPVGQAKARRTIPPSTYFECLTIILLTLALGQPSIPVGSSNQRTVVLVDRGHAMQAPTRAKAVADLLSQYPEAEVVPVGENTDTSQLNWSLEAARDQSQRTQLILIGDRFESSPPQSTIHVVEDPINNRGLTAAALSKDRLLVGVSASAVAAGKTATIAIEGTLPRVERIITLSADSQVNLLIPRHEIVDASTSSIVIKIEGSDDIAFDDSIELAVHPAPQVVGVEAGLDSVVDALLASGREVVRVGLAHDGESLSFIAGLWRENQVGRRLVFSAPNAAEQFSELVPRGKWSAYGSLTDLPLTIGEGLPIRRVAHSMTGSVVLLSRSGQPVVVGHPTEGTVIVGIDPLDAQWRNSEFYSLLIHRLAAWLTPSSSTPATQQLLSVAEVRGDATPSAAQSVPTALSSSAPEPASRWFIGAAFLILLGLMYTRSPSNR